MKGQYSLTLAFNVIFFIIFVLLLSYSMHVEGLRLLKDHSSSSMMEAAGLFISQDYSGPSRRGSGHWWEPSSVFHLVQGTKQSFISFQGKGFMINVTI
jgi:hypothetical protein